MSNCPLLIAQRAAYARHFQEGLFFKRVPSVDAYKDDTFEAGSPFKFKVLNEEEATTYPTGQISIKLKSVTIETFAQYEWTQKSKVKLATGITYQIVRVSSITIETSPYNRIKRYTLILG